jgi:hypothetical protein
LTAASVLRRHQTAHKRQDRGLAPVTLSALDPAYRYGRTIFASRVFDPDEAKRVLKDGHQSRKIGRFVTKGKRAGWPIFTLTLEERSTCPRTCKAWAFCYGNSMQAAERITAGPELETALWGELKQLQADHPTGFMVRLHVLGDFYSAGYVELWRKALDAFPALHVFGFTARPMDSEIGAELSRLMADVGFVRFAVRFSGLLTSTLGSQLQPDVHPDAIQCPAQTGKTDCCATCALCWHTRRSISFAKH